jgi:hypothetical protein
LRSSQRYGRRSSASRTTSEYPLSSWATRQTSKTSAASTGQKPFLSPSYGTFLTMRRAQERRVCRGFTPSPNLLPTLFPSLFPHPCFPKLCFPNLSPQPSSSSLLLQGRRADEKGGRDTDTVESANVEEVFVDLCRQMIRRGNSYDHMGEDDFDQKHEDTFASKRKRKKRRRGEHRCVIL